MISVYPKNNSILCFLVETEEAGDTAMSSVVETLDADEPLPYRGVAFLWNHDSTLALIRICVELDELFNVSKRRKREVEKLIDFNCSIPYRTILRSANLTHSTIIY